MPEETIIFVTGCAGFIGFHLAKRLLAQSSRVVGLDNINDYYDVTLKENRLSLLKQSDGFSFYRGDLADTDLLDKIFSLHRPKTVIHLAAQAGVGYSLVNPRAYIDSNITGFFNMLEACRKYPPLHFLFASSSSVYGTSKVIPFSADEAADHPASIYAATKRADELLAFSYSHLYGLAATGLRFFSVYGPWGRPDMACHIFTKAILSGESIRLFNYGQSERDFTYIDDLVECVSRLIKRPPQLTPSFRILNVGSSRPVRVTELIFLLEKQLGQKAKLVMCPPQPGDVPVTYAEISDLIREAGYHPETPIEIGITRFIEWYKSYYAPE